MKSDGGPRNVAFFNLADKEINNRELYEASVDTAVRHHTVLLRGAMTWTSQLVVRIPQRTRSDGRGV